jgi:phytoene synthase
MSFDADLTACAALVEKADPDRFAAAMANAVTARKVLFPLYAFNVEVARAPWVTQEPMIAEMRLQWWRDALEEIAKGGPIRRHEVVTPLASILSGEEAEALDKLVAVRRWDVYKDAFEDAAHFEAYLTDTAALLMRVAARALARAAGEKAPQAEAEDALRRLGYATGLARFLQAVPALEAQGRIPLVDGRAEAIAELARQAFADMPPRRNMRDLLPPSARPAMTEGFLTQSLLRQVASDPTRVAEGALVVPPLRRSLLLWRWS